MLDRVEVAAGALEGGIVPTFPRRSITAISGAATGHYGAWFEWSGRWLEGS
jgi:hypothetical protein